MLELLRHMVKHHHVLTNFIVRDIKVKYRGTVFGYLWSLLEPLSLVGIYWFVFVVIARRGGPDYPLVVMLGVLPYQFFNLVVSGGTGALVTNAALIRRVYLPRELFVLGQVGSNLFVLVVSLLVTIPFLIAYRVVPGASLALLPVGILLLAAFSTGLALLLACANAMYRDVGYLVRVILRLTFYACPVIYSVDMVPASIRDIYLLNPLAVILSTIRASVMNQPLPFSFGHGVLAVAVALGTAALGAALFRRWEPKAVKFL